MKNDNNLAYATVLFVLILSAIIAVLAPVLQPNVKIFFIHFGFPFNPGVFGSDFHVHDYVARNVPLTVDMYSVRNPFQAEPYGSPPLLPLFFKWSVLFNSNLSARLWSVLILAGVFISSYITVSGFSAASGKHFYFLRRSERALLASMLLISYPVLFAYERGATDILFLIPFTVTFFCIFKDRYYFTAGACSVLPVFFKVYPLFFAASVSLLGIVFIMKGFSESPGKKVMFRNGLLILAGQAALSVCVLMLHPQIYWFYITQVIGSIRQYIVSIPISHSLTLAYGTAGYAVFFLIWILMTAAFIFSCVRRSILSSTAEKSDEDRVQPLAAVSMLSLCGIAHFASFAVPAAFDYSLILSVPLIIALISIRNIGSERLFYASLVCLMLEFALPRWLFPQAGPSFLKGSIFFNIGLLSVSLLVIGLIMSIRNLSRNTQH